MYFMLKTESVSDEERWILHAGRGTSEKDLLWSEAWDCWSGGCREHYWAVNEEEDQEQDCSS